MLVKEPNDDNGSDCNGCFLSLTAVTMSVQGIAGKCHKLRLLEPVWHRMRLIREVAHEAIDSAHGSQEKVHTCVNTACTSTQVAIWGPLYYYFTRPQDQAGPRPTED